MGTVKLQDFDEGEEIPGENHADSIGRSAIPAKMSDTTQPPLPPGLLEELPEEQVVLAAWNRGIASPDEHVTQEV